MKINCESCGKEIEKKGNRTVCVKCANIRNREVAKKYREDHREYLNEQSKKNYHMKKNNIKNN